MYFGVVVHVFWGCSARILALLCVYFGVVMRVFLALLCVYSAELCVCFGVVMRVFSRCYARILAESKTRLVAFSLH